VAKTLNKREALKHGFPDIIEIEGEAAVLRRAYYRESDNTIVPVYQTLKHGRQLVPNKYITKRKTLKREHGTIFIKKHHMIELGFPSQLEYEGKVVSLASGYLDSKDLIKVRYAYKDETGKIKQVAIPYLTRKATKEEVQKIMQWSQYPYQIEIDFTSQEETKEKIDKKKLLMKFVDGLVVSGNQSASSILAQMLLSTSDKEEVKEIIKLLKEIDDDIAKVVLSLY